MIPSTLLGLVVLAASIGPGYVWVRVAETRVPRSPRTQLLEVAELIIVGGLASTLSFLTVFSVASSASWIDTDAFATDGTDYLLRHPARGFGVVFAGLALAYLGSYLVARLVYWKKPRIITHGSSAWHRVLVPDRDVYATVDLRDGTTIAGWVWLCTVDEVPLDQRELVLVATLRTPLRIRPANADKFLNSGDGAIVLNGVDVRTISATHHAVAAATSRRSRRVWEWATRPLRRGS